MSRTEQLDIPTRPEIDAQPDSDLLDGDYRCTICDAIVDCEKIDLLLWEMEVCARVECGLAVIKKLKELYRVGRR